MGWEPNKSRQVICKGLVFQSTLLISFNTFPLINSGLLHIRNYLTRNLKWNNFKGCLSNRERKNIPWPNSLQKQTLNPWILWEIEPSCLCFFSGPQIEVKREGYGKSKAIYGRWERNVSHLEVSIVWIPRNDDRHPNPFIMSQWVVGDRGGVRFISFIRTKCHCSVHCIE